MEIIPAIDIIGGKCVRLTQGDYDQKKEYNHSPLEVAQQLEDHGIRRLHLVDLDGAKQKHVVNLNVLESIATQTQLHIDFGGGVQSDEDLQRVFDAGAQQVTGGSIAVRQPDTFLSWLEQYGSDKIILGADAKDRKIAVHGWQEQTEWEVLDFINHYHTKGIKYVICTDVAKDGLLQGPSLKLYQDILQELPEIKLIASGGVTTVDDLHQLKEAGLHGVIIGKALLEGRIKLTELREFL
ncbi:MAG: 1-(5-phosphoribosyl)-5-[(5-phosphoribosylamino)methylideneamino]imidazole-4-carboxamide isomerase [Bacteroidota bacterium]